MDSIARIPDEELKCLMGAPDPIRNAQAYIAHTDHAEEIRAHFARNYFQPADRDISSRRVKRFLQSDDISMIVPMREDGPVMRPMLSVNTRLISARQIRVLNDGSDEAACAEVRQHGVHLIPTKDLLDLLSWDRLLPILALEERPRGKGVAVLAGYLLLYLLAEQTGQTPLWVCQHDSEIMDYHLYRGLEYLAWGALQRKNAHYIKMAKGGRGNDRCMQARSLLRKRARRCQDPQAQKRMHELFMRLTPHKWMLTGEFMLKWQLAMQRPFATGYLEETLVSAFAEDVGAAIGCCTVQVANPNPRMDAANLDEKEAIMQHQISSFIEDLLPYEPPINHWTLEDITRINHEQMSEPEEVSWIENGNDPNKDADGPVEFKPVENNRIFPSIAMLSQGGFINNEEADAFMSRFLAEGAA